MKVINIHTGHREMFGGIQKPSGHNPGQLSLDSLTWKDMGFEQDDLDDFPAST